MTKKPAPALASTKAKKALPLFVRHDKPPASTKPNWPWRDFLTEAETRLVDRTAAAKDSADKAKARWHALKAKTDPIVNRAIQRAKYHHKLEHKAAAA